MFERKFFFVLVAALSAAPTAYAQLSTASVNGTLRDASGAVISGGTVSLRNRATQIERTTTSNEAGNFVLLDMPPGNYTLEARQSGFAPARLESFDLAVNQTLTIDLTLAVGTVEQSLTVQGVATQVENSTAELGAVITSKPVVIFRSTAATSRNCFHSPPEPHLRMFLKTLEATPEMPEHRPAFHR
jgi:Carboxypeptidase regulatory-like domain